MNVVHELGGRFLEPIGGNAWQVVDVKRSVEKTSQCLREKRHGPKQQATRRVVSLAVKAKVSQEKDQVGTTSKAA